jgi:hypothetical protein
VAEVVGGEVEAAAVGAFPVSAEPLHIALDGVDVLLLFLGGVGVIEAEVELAAVLPGRPELRQMLLAWPMWR